MRPSGSTKTQPRWDGLGKESVLAVDAEDDALAHYAIADVNVFL